MSQSLHTYLGKPGPNDQYFSEDFADFIATKILPADTKYPDCEYLTYSADNAEYNEDH